MGSRKSALREKEQTTGCHREAGNRPQARTKGSLAAQPRSLTPKFVFLEDCSGALTASNGCTEGRSGDARVWGTAVSGDTASHYSSAGPGLTRPTDERYLPRPWPGVTAPSSAPPPPSSLRSWSSDAKRSSARAIRRTCTGGTRDRVG